MLVKEGQQEPFFTLLSLSTAEAKDISQVTSLACGFIYVTKITPKTPFLLSHASSALGTAVLQKQGEGS